MGVSNQMAAIMVLLALILVAASLSVVSALVELVGEAERYADLALLGMHGCAAIAERARRETGAGADMPAPAPVEAA